MRFIKKSATVSYDKFFRFIGKLTEFKSSGNKRYHVETIDKDIMHFKRLDAQRNHKLYKIDLKALYKAYVELNDYKTDEFRPYVGSNRSPGRGILLSAGLIG